MVLPRTRKKTIGDRGEAIAVKMFKKMGFKVIERNYRASHYEIDFIAMDKEHVVFVEVKARSCEDPENMPFGRPSRAVTASKQSYLINAARAYLKLNRKCDGLLVRFDVVEVFFDKNENVNKKKVLKTNHIRNAFRA